MVDSSTWAALALVLTVLGVVVTWACFRRRGAASGVRALGVTLLVPAAYLTGTLRLVGRVVDAVGSWATGLVLGPTVWVGVGLAGVAVVLLGVAGRLPRRTGGGEVEQGSPRPEVARPPAGSTKSRPAADDPDGSMAEIEDILRSRGIQ